MVRRTMSARVENHVRGDAKFLGGGDTCDYPADHGGDGLPLPQYPHIQSETAGWSLSEGGSAGRIIDYPAAANQIHIVIRVSHLSQHMTRVPANALRNALIVL